MIFALKPIMPTPSQVQAPSSAPSQETGRLHLGYLDGLRACAAIFVVLHHSWLEVWPGTGPASPVWTRWLTLGHAAVDLFIVLSGFCLMLPVVRSGGILRGGALLFFTKRARRILPPYYFAVAFSLLLIWTIIGKPTNTHWDISLPVTGRTLASHLLLLQNFTPSGVYKINYAFWSVSLEWWIYFLFPPLVLSWKRLGPGVTTLLALAGSFLLCRICLHEFHQSFTLQYIALFTFGMLGAEIVHGRHQTLSLLRDRLPWGLLTWLAAGLAVLALHQKVSHFHEAENSDLLVGLWAMCLLIFFGLRAGSLLGCGLSQKPMLFLGSFAYSIYLIHAPLIQVFRQYVLHPLRLAPTPTFLLLAVVGTPLIVAVSYLFHLAFERPFMTRPGVKIRTEAQAEAAAITNPAP